ncbi:hypothetical protein ACFQZ4_39875 [Catellatospora coxensis]|uniref:Uncharacterized protein n=1 Tax=Catellatospora coxensis TaxID=310354 RepID=A0A8J3L5X0_9ACTN|nr:hypothetical protein [Catellatospora coxensis]GIG09729.1 hypothetical protein Cco03nite_64290 [Catellatospora coxensis]
MVTSSTDESDRPNWANWPTRQVQPIAERMTAAVAVKNEELGFAGDEVPWYAQPTGFYRGIITGLRGLR